MTDITGTPCPACHTTGCRCIVITLGAGKCVANWGEYNGAGAVFLEPLPDDNPGIEGRYVPPELQTPKDRVAAGTVILSFEGHPSAFLDCLSKALPVATTEAPDLVERVAIALANYDASQVMDVPQIANIDEFRFDVDREDYLKRARAALAAIPSQAGEQLIDMANVGEALMEAIRDYSEQLKGWAPADCPSEIVGDLLIRIESKDAQLAAKDQEIARLTEALEQITRFEEGIGRFWRDIARAALKGSGNVG